MVLIFCLDHRWFYSPFEQSKTKVDRLQRLEANKNGTTTVLSMEHIQKIWVSLVLGHTAVTALKGTRFSVTAGEFRQHHWNLLPDLAKVYVLNDLPADYNKHIPQR